MPWKDPVTPWWPSSTLGSVTSKKGHAALGKSMHSNLEVQFSWTLESFHRTDLVTSGNVFRFGSQLPKVPTRTLCCARTQGLVLYSWANSPILEKLHISVSQVLQNDQTTAFQQTMDLIWVVSIEKHLVNLQTSCNFTMCYSPLEQVVPHRVSGSILSTFKKI